MLLLRIIFFGCQYRKTFETINTYSHTRRANADFDVCKAAKMNGQPMLSEACARYSDKYNLDWLGIVSEVDLYFLLLV